MESLRIRQEVILIFCILNIPVIFGNENITMNISILVSGTLPSVRFETFNILPEVHKNVEKSDSLTYTAPPLEIATMVDSFVPPEIQFEFENRPVLLEAICTDCLPNFRGPDDIFSTMSEWSNLVCGKSVCNETLDRKTCGNLRCDKCHCDSECVGYGDCCPDLFLKTPYQTPAVNPVCVSQAFIGAPKVGAHTYKLVGTCPEITISSEDQVDTAAKCKHPDITTIEDNIPVYSPQTKFHYRNLHCAKCYGETDVIDWLVKPFCTDYVDFSDITSPQDLLSVMRLEDSCAIHFEPPKETTPRSCIYTADPIRTCNVSGQWSRYDPEIERACLLYSQPVEYFLKTYNNIFCVYCDGVMLHGRESCGHSITGPSNPPFSVLLDFRQTMQEPVVTERTQCSPTEVFDPTIDGCRPLVCPVGKYPKNHTCTSLFQSADGLGYVLHFRLTPKHQEYFTVSSLYGLTYSMFDHISEKTHNFGQKFAVYHGNITFRTTNDSLDFQVLELDIQFSTLVGGVIPRQEAEEQLLGLFQRRWWWFDFTTSSFMDLDFKWLPDVSDERLRLGYNDLRADFSQEPTDTVRTGSILMRDQNLGDTIPEAFLRNISSYIMVSELLTCNNIELNVSEYTTLQPDRVYINSTGETLDEGQFIWNNDRVRVCTNLTGDNNAKAETIGTFDPTEVILTLVCSSLSLCGLAVTVIIYLAMPSLRKHLPGKNNIFLFVNLFLAQLLFLSGSVANVSTSACRALGVIIHYFWLSTFCWKVVCAFHMYRLFTNPLKTLDPKRTLYKYIVFSQVFPCTVIFLIIFVNFGLSDTAQIGYAGRTNICFLSGTLDVALGFALPVGLVILINALFFSRVIYAIRHRPTVQRHASKSDVKESVIYFKMSLILGFTWTLGFIALIVDAPGMWYVFTVANAGLGMFVFICFGLKNLSAAFLMRGNFSREDRMVTNGSKTYETTTGTISKEQEALGETYTDVRGSIHKSPDRTQSNQV